MPFLEQDRRFLLLAAEQAEAALRPPQRLGQRPEAAWAAVLALPGREPLAAVYSSGDREDAVRKLLSRCGAPADPCATLYLSLEPKASFERLPPVTSSVLKLGVKRVVIGALDPALKYRGEGRRALEQSGVEVVLGDGEEARRCQQLLDDFAKWLQKGLPVLRARVELRRSSGGRHELSFAGKLNPQPGADAVICRAGSHRRSGEGWRVVIDAEGWEKAGERDVLYQGTPQSSGPAWRRLPVRDGIPDLGSILRDLGSLGIVSAEIADDPELFRMALKSRLLDSVTASFPDSSEPHPSLSEIHTVRLTEGGLPLELRLEGARLIGGAVEARVELC